MSKETVQTISSWIFETFSNKYTYSEKQFLYDQKYLQSSQYKNLLEPHVARTWLFVSNTSPKCIFREGLWTHLRKFACRLRFILKQK